jgi:hypothetical protein
MGSTLPTPNAQQKRFSVYMDRLVKAAGHADRSVPLKNYCTGLLLPGERKSVEPIAARLAPENVRRMHQSLRHVVADAPWSDEDVLREVRNYVLPNGYSFLGIRYHPPPSTLPGLSSAWRGTTKAGVGEGFIITPHSG